MISFPDIFNSFWYYSVDYIVVILALFFVMVLGIIVYRIVQAYRESHRFFG